MSSGRGMLVSVDASTIDDGMHDEQLDQQQDEPQVKVQTRRQIKTKGRGFKSQYELSSSEKYTGHDGEYESLQDNPETDAQKSIEGWILIVTNLHEECSEDDVYELFADHGDISQLHLNLDRRTGYVKGYALVQFSTFKQAMSALQALNGHVLHDKPMSVDWAFKKRERGGARTSQNYGGAHRKREIHVKKRDE